MSTTGLSSSSQTGTGSFIFAVAERPGREDSMNEKRKAQTTGCLAVGCGIVIAIPVLGVAWFVVTLILGI